MSWWNIGLGIANALTNAAQVGVSAWQTTEQSKQQETTKTIPNTTTKFKR